MAEELDDFPQAFANEEVMPWERDPDAPVWPWGLDRGKVLTEIASRELLRKLRWLQDRDTHQDLQQAIDAVLTERGGE